MENPQTINLTFLNHFTSGKKDMMIAFIQKFLETVPAAVTEVEQYLLAKDWKSLRTAAHSLKPQFSYMGINHLGEVLLAIENNANDEINLDDLPRLVKELKEGCANSYLELEQIITSLR